MASHVPFTPGSSYLLDALVPVPLPFLFPWLPPCMAVVFHLFFGLFVPPVWVLRLLAFCSPSPEAGSLCAPTMSFSHHHHHQRCFGQIALEPSPVDCSAFCFMFSLVSLLFVCFVCFLIFIVLLIFFTSVSLYFVHPGLFPLHYRVELPMRPSVYRFCLHTLDFIPLYFYCFLLVISPVSIGLLSGVMLSPIFGLWM
jgi:hypothetical protein